MTTTQIFRACANGRITAGEAARLLMGDKKVEELVELREEIGRLREDGWNTLTKLTEVHATVRARDAEIEQLRKSLDTATKSEVQRSEEAEALARDLHTVQKQLDEYTSAHSGLRAECGRLEARLDEANKRADDAELVVSELQDKVAMLRELERQLAEKTEIAQKYEDRYFGALSALQRRRG